MDWFSFFSEPRECFRKKAINPFVATEQLNLEFALIKSMKGYKQVKEKVQKILEMVDLETKEREERKSMLLLPTNELAKNDVMAHSCGAGSVNSFNKDKSIRKTTFNPGARTTDNIHVKKSSLSERIPGINISLKEAPEIAEEVKRKTSYVNSIINDGIPLKDEEVNSSKGELLLDKENSNNQSEGKFEHNLVIEVNNMSIPMIIEINCNSSNFKKYYSSKNKLQPNTGDEEPISIDILSDEEITYKQKPKEEKSCITNDKLNEVIECLRAVLEISTEGDELISQIIRKIETM